ncbi:hypothetical protein DXG01_001259 [Tephrocybe rancida]|nr:hypothetical protein DXG01_001259 [Tephrocybe rancida]
MQLAGWQEDMRAAWIDLSRCDEHRRVAKELKWLKTAKNTKGHDDRLAEIEEDEQRPRGKYLTDMDQWDLPLHSLEFFLKLCRQHYTPYYAIEGIHFKVPVEEIETNINVCVLGHLQSTPTIVPELPSPSQEVPPHATLPIVEMLQEANANMIDKDVEAEENGEGEPDDRVFYSEARRLHLEDCFGDLMDVIKGNRGVHPKLAKVLDDVFGQVEKVGGDISRHKRRKGSQQMWKDMNRNTLYID